MFQEERHMDVLERVLQGEPLLRTGALHVSTVLVNNVAGIHKGDAATLINPVFT